MSKEKQIQQMFSNIAPKYDFLNHFLSLGQDIIWRKKVANIIKNNRFTKIADIASGTGDLAIEINKKINHKIVGIDFCYEMLRIAKDKTDKILLINGDGTCLPLKDSLFQCVAIAFGIRNIPDRISALKEFHRILDKRGKVLILEFDIPDNLIFRFYFKYILPFIGGLFSSKDAYEYLPNSVRNFPREKEFCKEIETANFKIENVISMSLGMVKLYIGCK